LRADPEVIVLADAPHGVGVQALAARPGWAGLRALREGRVCELDQKAIDVLHRPGPRVAEALDVLASCLHPDTTTGRQ
jgi:iron complex transport system substrate-binding protein